MSANDYHFVTHWRVEGTVQEVSGILGDAVGLTRWWPSVYLAVKQLGPGAADGVGRVVELHTKGWLPYTLHWFFRVTESRSRMGSLSKPGVISKEPVCGRSRRTASSLTSRMTGESAPRSLCCVICRFC